MEIALAIALVAVIAALCLAYFGRAKLRLWIDRIGESSAAQQTDVRHPSFILFIASFATLFVEILLIRWIGTEVRVFAFFQNLALICCFLGFGLGCYWSDRRKSIFFSIAAIAALVVLVQTPIPMWKNFLMQISNLLSISPDSALWGNLRVFEGSAWALLFAASIVSVSAFLGLLIIVMIPIGQWVGFYLDSAANPVRAYSLNLLGSVAGIWIFAGMSFLRLPPAYWFLAGIAVLLLLQPLRLRYVIAVAVLAGVSLLLLKQPENSTEHTIWSPYQKVDMVELGGNEYSIYVNNTGYMNIANVTPEALATHPDVAERFREESSYDAPFRFIPHPDRVLIVGAGAGNDAAAALRNGAGNIDAVEIDPVILSFGERLHPEHPYDSPKVHKVVNDARAFLRQAQDRYDVIMFGLLDSHTQFSDYSNMRIDNYVYTQESLLEAKRLLKPTGVLVVKFEVRAPWTWMGQRFYRMLESLFGRAPIVFYTPRIGHLTSATVFLTSPDPQLWERAKTADLANLIATHQPSFPQTAQGAPEPTTDDWPYLYHRLHAIPRTYLSVSIILLVMSLLLVRGVLEPRQVSTWHFFFLGAGFLLLETQLVSRLALYFGTTWLVNCIALTAILLVLVLATAWVEKRRPQDLRIPFALLIVFLLANYFFPWQSLPWSARTVGILLSAAYSAPVFCAGIIFTETFRRCDRKSSAFGANIVGAVAGGLAQNVSFIFGMKALLILAAIFYGSAAVCNFLPQRQKAAL